MPVKAGINHLTIFIHPEVHLDMIAAQRVIVREGNIVRVQAAPVGWVLVMLNYDFSVQIVHIHTRIGAGPSRKSP